MSKLELLEYETLGPIEQLQAYKLMHYFHETNNHSKVVDILTKKNGISLRDYDAFVTKYANIHTYWYYHEGNEFVLYDRYKSALESHHKGLLDPFRRGNRIEVKYGGDKYETTIGQLNFAKFLIEYKVLEHIYKLYPSIRVELQVLKKTKTRKIKVK